MSNVYFSTDSSIDLDCSLGNDDANYLLQQQSTTLQLPNQQHSTTPFGMDLSVEFGHSSNRSSIVSQVFLSLNLASHGINRLFLHRILNLLPI